MDQDLRDLYNEIVKLHFDNFNAYANDQFSAKSAEYLAKAQLSLEVSEMLFTLLLKHQVFKIIEQ